MLGDPVLDPGLDHSVGDSVETCTPEGGLAMLDPHLGRHAVALGDGFDHLDRPTLRVGAIHRQEVAPVEVFAGLGVLDVHIGDRHSPARSHSRASIRSKKARTTSSGASIRRSIEQRCSPMDRVKPVIDVTPWQGLELIEPVSDGNRNEVWRAQLGGTQVSVRRSRRSPESLTWELDLLGFLDRAGFRVPIPIRCDNGRRSVGGVVVQLWLSGRSPSSVADWRVVGLELQRLHAETADYPQRPGCVTVRELGDARRSVDADVDVLPVSAVDLVLGVFERFDDVPTAVVHGDPGPGNVRIGSDGRVGLLDWDESRVDLVWHDLSNLGTQILCDRSHRRSQTLSNAWEAVNAWAIEPEYALERFDRLQHGDWR